MRWWFKYNQSKLYRKYNFDPHCYIIRKAKIYKTFKHLLFNFYKKKKIISFKNFLNFKKKRFKTRKIFKKKKKKIIDIKKKFFLFESNNTDLKKLQSAKNYYKKIFKNRNLNIKNNLNKNLNIARNWKKNFWSKFKYNYFNKYFGKKKNVVLKINYSLFFKKKKTL